MAQADWTEMTGVLGTSIVDRGVTAGIARPNGGGSFLYGFNSLDVTEGAVALFCNLTNFAPMAKGGSIRMAMKRGISGGPLNFSPYIFIGAASSAVSSVAYMLGLSDADPSRITLRKGTLIGGVPDGDITQPPTNGILAHSSDTISKDTYVHLRLDVIVNTNGDVVLNCFRSDLVANAVTAPVWSPIPGLDQFIDDVLQVNTGSAPLLTGRAGWGFYSKDVSRRAYFDHAELLRQT